MANFYIKWKGEISGPFSNSEILEMLNTGKIGLLHEIREENSESWQFLKDFDISKAGKCASKEIGRRYDVRRFFPRRGFFSPPYNISLCYTI